MSCFIIFEIFALIFNLKNPYLFCIMMLFSSAGAVVPINFMYSKLFMQGYFYNKTIFSTIFINCFMTFISLLIFVFILKKYKDIRGDFGFNA